MIEMIGKKAIDRELLTIPRLREYLEQRKKEAEEEVKQAKEEMERIKIKKEKAASKTEEETPDNVCEICGKEYKSARGVKIHQRQSHTEEEIAGIGKEEEHEEDDSIEERVGLKYEQKLALQYAQEFGKEDPERTDKAVEEIKDMDIDEEIAVEIVNLMPTKEEQINLVFEKKRFDIKKDQAKKILKIIEDLRESKEE